MSPRSRCLRQVRLFLLLDDEDLAGSAESFIRTCANFSDDDFCSKHVVGIGVQDRHKSDIELLSKFRDGEIDLPD